MPEQTKDIATVFEGAYSRSAPKVLGNQHAFLLSALENHFGKIGGGNLVVVGPGGHALPYSCSYNEDGELGNTNRERIKDIIKKGTILFIDYLVGEGNEGLSKTIRTLEALDFFEKDRGFFAFDGLITSPEQELRLDQSAHDLNSIFLKNNLRDKLMVADSEADAIDANLSVHHASITRAELERVYSEFYRILKPGGLLHLGEGSVDMNYSEDKIVRIGQELAFILDEQVVMVDNRERENGYVTQALFKPKKLYAKFPVVEDESSLPERYVSAEVTEGGMVRVKADSPAQILLKRGKARIVAEKMRKEGYKQISVSGGSIELPIIDPSMTSDVKSYIEPVNAYYDAIIRMAAKGYKGVNDELVSQHMKGVEFEREHALRGTVEYYMGEGTIKNTLRKVGFKNINVQTHIGPFYNITAEKVK